MPGMRTLIDISAGANRRVLSEAVDTASSQFLRWFGNSKVVDHQGLPLRLFHGTRQDFRAFQGTVWASNSPELANIYARNTLGSRIVPLYMRIEHPFDADLGLSDSVTVDEFLNAMFEQSARNGFSTMSVNSKAVSGLLDSFRAAEREESIHPYYSRHAFWQDVASWFGPKGAKALGSLFKMLGFDGVRMVENGDITFGAFSPNQVKSIFNRGSFDDDQADISESAT